MDTLNYLNPFAIKIQCLSAIENLRRDNESLSIASRSIEAFISDESLQAEGFEALRIQMSGYQTVINGLRFANMLDMSDYATLMSSVGNEILDGNIIVKQMEQSWDSMLMNCDSAEKYEGWADLYRGEPDFLGWYYSWKAKWYRFQEYLDRLSYEYWEKKANAYDSIENATAGLFQNSNSLRECALEGIEALGKSFSNGEFAPKLVRVWSKKCSQTIDYLNSLSSVYGKDSRFNDGELEWFNLYNNWENVLKGAGLTKEHFKSKFQDATFFDVLYYILGVKPQNPEMLRSNAYSIHDKDEALAWDWLEDIVDVWKYKSQSYHVWQYMTKIGVFDDIFAAMDFVKDESDEHPCYHVDIDGFPMDVAKRHFGNWQEVGGYIDAYDVIFDVFCDMERDKFEFDVNGEDYTLWFWKGEYMNLGAGGESGIYKGDSQNIVAVDKNMEVPMALTVQFQDGTSYRWNSGGEPTWWNTSFDPNQQNVSVTDFTITYEIDFSDKPETWEGIKNEAKIRKEYVFDDDTKVLKYSM